jgi:uncharacterized membrane protein
MLNTAEKRAIAILIILYAVGIVGTLFVSESILMLTPVNLLISLGIVLWFHPFFERKFVLYAGIVFFTSFILEWAGVRTGKIFGQYSYGNNLGLKIFDVPLVIGINWLMLSYCSMQVVHKLLGRFQLPNPELLNAFVAALLMLILDILIEPVSGFMDFWYWENQLPPINNYTAWFSFALAFNFIYAKMQLPYGNRLALWLFALQLVFFLAMNIKFQMM